MSNTPGTASPEAASLIQRAQTLLSTALDSRDAPCRYPVLATADGAGGVNARVLILRAFNSANWQVMLHTDRRSAKMSEIAGSGAASLVFYDHASALQLRMKGIVTVGEDEGARARVWKSLPDSNKTNYRSAEPPGTFLEKPGARAGEGEGGDGFENFAVLCFAPDSIDILALSPAGNRRYRFETGRSRGSWLVP